MTLQKNNRYKEYILELDEIKGHLCKNQWGTPPLQRRFYEHRKLLIEDLITNYLNTTDEQKHN